MIRPIVLSGVLCLTSCAAPPGATVPGPANTSAVPDATVVPAGRLSDSVWPIAYGLDLTIVPKREDFSGHVRIDLDIRIPLDRFYLHASELRVSETLLRLEDGNIVIATFRQTEVSGVAEIVLSRSVAPQKATLEISYTGRFGQRLKGLYRVVDGGEAYAYTQFEPISARQAFPCFDEPAFKTPFTVTLNVQRGHVAIASTPEIEQIPLENGLVRIRFATTPPLPTYLIAFAVGPLDVVTAPDIPATKQRDVPLPLRGIATAGKGGRLAHALGTTPPLLILLEEYFDMAHPYPKLDILAVPEFASGAMENVGAITYRESLLLLADDAPVQQRRRHALVHAHELAHMWFGNLVTMPWWDDIWLNESFATWMAYKTVAAWNPEHGATLSRLDSLTMAMNEDALSSARQIRQPIETNHDIENAFDRITYSKGGAVLTMFERYLGEDHFREAIRYHLRRFQHGNADVDDFIASVEHVGGQSAGDALRSFLFQPGIPVLDFALDCGATPAVTIRQTRFKPIGSEAGDGKGWTVPVCLRYGNDDEQHESCHLAGPETTAVPLDTEQCPQWLLPNADYAGYFHWVMPQSAYPGLIAGTTPLSAVERLSVAGSINAALASGRMTVSEAAPLLAMFAKFSKPAVAMAPGQFIAYTRDNLVYRDSTLQGLKGFVETLYGDVPAERAFDPQYMKTVKRDAGRLLLVHVAELRAWAGNQTLRAAAVERARDWIAGRDERLAPSSVDLALRLAIEETGDAAVEPLLGRLRNSRDGQERRTILYALARATDPRVAARMRDFSILNDIRINEIRNFLTQHVKEAANRPAAWSWLQQNFDSLVDRLPPRDAGRIPADLTAGLCDESLAAEVQTFLAPRMADLTGGPRNLAKTVEGIRLCARRAAVQRSQADDFFQIGQR